MQFKRTDAFDLRSQTNPITLYELAYFSFGVSISEKAALD